MNSQNQDRSNPNGNNIVKERKNLKQAKT